MSVKALGIALKLTLSGMNQLVYPQTWAFAMIVAACVVTQMNYLNKVIRCEQSISFVSYVRMSLCVLGKKEKGWGCMCLPCLLLEQDGGSVLSIVKVFPLGWSLNLKTTDLIAYLVPNLCLSTVLNFVIHSSIAILVEQ